MTYVSLVIGHQTARAKSGNLPGMSSNDNIKRAISHDANMNKTKNTFHKLTKQEIDLSSTLYTEPVQWG